RVRRIVDSLEVGFVFGKQQLDRLVVTRSHIPPAMAQLFVSGLRYCRTSRVDYLASSIGSTTPRVAIPEVGSYVLRSGLLSSVGSRDRTEKILGAHLGVLNLDVEVALGEKLLPKGIEQFILRLQLIPLAIDRH